LSDRIIFHCDCDSFFASVEETFQPEYKDVPMAVAGDPELRHGIILAKNQKAKAFGIKTAETIWSAKKKCPDLVLAPPRRGAYSDFCKHINKIYENYTDQVEVLGIDESYLDVTGSLHLFGGDPEILAKIIQQRIEKETGVTVSIGISWNKIFAKLGSDQNKPSGIFVITRQNFRDTVWHLPISELYSVGKNTAETLRKHFISTIGELARTSEAVLTRWLGKHGGELYRYANGLEESPVLRVGEGEPVKSVGNGRTFRRDLTTRSDIHKGLVALCDSVASRMRKKGVKCHTLQVTIKDATLKSIQRQRKLDNPTYLCAELVAVAAEIIEENWTIGKPIRMLTITGQNLVPEDQATEQITLFDTGGKRSEKTEKLEKAMDTIRDKYGRQSVLPGAFLGNDLGIDGEE